MSEENLQVMHLSHFSCAAYIVNPLKASKCLSGFVSITQSTLLALSLQSLERNTGFFQNAFIKFSSCTLELPFFVSFKTRRGSGSWISLSCPPAPFTAASSPTLDVNTGDYTMGSTERSQWLLSALPDQQRYRHRIRAGQMKRGRGSLDSDQFQAQAVEGWVQEMAPKNKAPEPQQLAPCRGCPAQHGCAEGCGLGWARWWWTISEYFMVVFICSSHFEVGQWCIHFTEEELESWVGYNLCVKLTVSPKCVVSWVLLGLWFDSETSPLECHKSRSLPSQFV